MADRRSLLSDGIFGDWIRRWRDCLNCECYSSLVSSLR